MKSDKPNFLSKYSAILQAVIGTFAVAGGLYAAVIEPRLKEKIKTEVTSCQTEFKKDSDTKYELLKSELNERHKRLSSRLLKIECGLYVKMTSKERKEASELYEQLGGK
jgi:hypothetical protein